jgi:hypothetical protein
LNFPSSGDYYGQRVSGSIVLPATGNWRFWISGDDQAELWLSPSWKSSEKRKVANLTTWGSPLSFDSHASQRSNLLPLVAGVPYYFEILHKEYAGGDHAAVAWSYESSNWALASLGSTATQSSTGWSGVPARAIDGNTNGLWGASTITHTLDQQNSWWQLDFGQQRRINRVVLWNRTDVGAESRLSNFRISVTDSAGLEVAGKNFFPPGSGHAGASMVWDLPQTVSARHIRISLLGHNNAGNGYLSLAEVQAFEQHSDSVRTIVPATALQSQIPDPQDANGNSLPDEWEIQYGLTNPTRNGAPASEYADPDGDLLTNLQEAQLGLDPLAPSRAPGLLLHERWNGILGYSVDELITAPAFYGTPASRQLTAPSDLKLTGTYFGTRSRGYFEPQVSGHHTFWISARNSAELWISDDSVAGKYPKRRIAAIDPKLGTGHGIDSSSTNLWDQFASQQSKPVYLEAGHSYYLEIIHQNGHGGNPHSSLAWAVNGGPRIPIPASAVESYLTTPDDADDDYLPDAWETQYGLNPSDNGSIDMARQGERGDHDGDGLTNREEYLLGTNPANSDTDGDGVSDFNEVHHYKTSPTESGFLPSVALTEIDLVADLIEQGHWEISGSRLVSASYRNHARWNFEVPEDGIFQLELALRMSVVNVREASSTLLASIDGISAGQYEIRFGANHQAQVFINLPYLEAGTHQLALQLAGLRAIGNFSLESMTLKRPSGLDIDGDGLSESHLDSLKQRSHLTVLPGSSFLSPYVVEGASPSLAAVSLTADNAAITPQPGVGSTGWMAEINLGESPVELDATFERGGFNEQRTLTWTPLDLCQSHTLHARVGDTLKFSTPISPGTWVEVTAPLGHTVQVPLLAQIGKWQFTTLGKHTLRWRNQQGLRTESFIHVYPRVISANLSTSIKGRIRELTPSQDTRGLTPDGGDAIRLASRLPLSTGEKLTLAMLQSGAVNLGFREPQTGRLLSLLPIEIIEFSDALGSQDHGSFDSGDPATHGVVYRMAFADLPVGWTVDVSIFRAGVTFRDGTVARTYSRSDLENGILSLEMLHPITLAGGLCHRYVIRDASGSTVW